MKKIFFILASAALLLTACHNDEEHRPAEGEGCLSFQVINYQQYSLDDETTRAAVSSVDHLDMAIYDGTTKELVKHLHQPKDTTGYGTFSVTLPYGTYHAVFLGYKGERRANVENLESICFPDDFVPHLFAKTLSITIDNPEEEAQSVSLKRQVAAFKLGSRGDNPGNLSTLTIEATGGSHHFNALTGVGAQVESRSYTYDVSKKAGADTLSVTFFTFLTNEEATMSFTATARDASQEELRKREFTNVPMKINQRTQYNGYFFDADKGTSGFTLSLDDEEMTNTTYSY